MEPSNNTTLDKLDELVGEIKGGKFATILAVTGDADSGQTHALQVNGGENRSAEEVCDHLFNLGRSLGHVLGTYAEQVQDDVSTRAFLASVVAGVNDGAKDHLAAATLEFAEPPTEAVN